MASTSTAPFRLLGLPPGSTVEEIRRAYRRLARRFHPDLAGPESHARFAEITAAYNELTGRQEPSRPRPEPRPGRAPFGAAHDEAERAEAFARWRRRAAAHRSAAASRPEPAPAAPTAEPGPEAPQPAAEPEAETPERFETREAPRRLPAWLERLRVRLGRARVEGEDVTLRLPVDVDTVLRGGEQRLAVMRLVACPDCGGESTGRRHAPCACGGAGRVRVREQVKVVVPAGARPGVRLRLPGKGTDGLLGRPAGDLYLSIEPAELPGFRRDGADLHALVELPRQLVTAGGPIDVRGPWGGLRLDLPPGVRPGTRFRLAGQGLPVWGRADRGDLYLTVQVGSVG